MKLCSRKIASGSPKIECEIQTGQNVLSSARSRRSGQQREERHLQRHDLQREDRDEQEVAAPEVDPGEARRRRAARG